MTSQTPWPWFWCERGTAACDNPTNPCRFPPPSLGVASLLCRSHVSRPNSALAGPENKLRCATATTALSDCFLIVEVRLWRTRLVRRRQDNLRTTPTSLRILSMVVWGTTPVSCVAVFAHRMRTDKNRVIFLCICYFCWLFWPGSHEGNGWRFLFIFHLCVCSQTPTPVV